MGKKVTMFDVYRGDTFLERCHLNRAEKILECHHSTILKKFRQSKSNEVFWKEFKVVRIKGISQEEYLENRRRMENEKILGDYYNSLYRGLHMSGIAIGKHSIEPEKQIQRLKEMGMEGSFRFIPRKEGRTKWFRVEWIRT